MCQKMAPHQHPKQQLLTWRHLTGSSERMSNKFSHLSHLHPFPFSNTSLLSKKSNSTKTSFKMLDIQTHKPPQKQTSHAKTMPFFLLLLFIPQISLSSSTNPSIPITCKTPSSTPTCNSFLYTQSKNRSLSAISSLYSSNSSLSRTLTRPDNTVDYLLQVPCTCTTVKATTALFYNTNYLVVANDTPDYITSYVFSGLAWNVEGGLKAGESIAVYLPCGCLEGAGMVVSYAVEMGDTVLKISGMLGADAGDVVRMNSQLVANPDFVDVGWVLFVPIRVERGQGKGRGEAAE